MVVRTVVVTALSHRTGAARWFIRLSILGLPVLGAWGWEIARNVFDAVLAAGWSEHEVPHWRAMAASFDVGGL
jgi:hypothetical protein